MTCASCAMRIERRLNKLPGVIASVNYATEKAHVELPAGVSVETAIQTVTEIGYTATLPAPPASATATPDPAEQGSEHSAAEAWRQRLIISAALALPVLLMSMIPALQFTNWQWAALTLASPVVVWGAWPFHRAMWLNLRHRSATMDTLISVGVSAAYLWSLYALFFGMAGHPGMKMDWELMPSRDGASGHIYLEVAAAVTVFITAGRYFETRARADAGAALRALSQLGAKEVAVRRNGAEQRIPIEGLVVGDEFVVRPGEKVATDGVVVTGQSAIDASLITGEPVPVDVSPGDAVVGATINSFGVLVVRATRVGADTQLAQIGRLVEAAQSGKAPVQRLADRVAAVFVPVVIALSLFTLGFWLLHGSGAEFAFSAAVAVLIIACPCALGLATPTALLVGTGRAAQLGILIRGPQVLESTRRIDTIVLDKTGTITTGQMTLAVALPAPRVERARLLRLAGAVEAGSEHPIGRAISAGAQAELGELPAVSGFTASAGQGVTGVVGGQSVLAGRPAWLAAEHAITISDDTLATVSSAQREGGTAVVAASGGEVLGVLVVSDTIKATSRGAIERLRAMGLRPMLLTGDNQAAATAIASEVGIPGTDVISEVLPADKLQVITAQQQAGRVVAMVGDGVNDAAALAGADLGIAMGSGTDAAIHASDLTVVRSDLLGVVDAIRLSRRTLGTIKGNLFWAFAYNVAALPLAMAGLLNPLIAGAAMAFSSVFVVSNSLRLRGFQPDGRQAT
ncbi:MAG: heavy metal translocating P-type ATPase [Candidatus Nanopelagicales bacterium]